MRPIPATRLGHAHGLLRAIDTRGRLRTDEFVTEFSIEELFPADLENALGRLRHFISYARAAGLVKEDRGVVELTDTGRRYIRAGDADHPFEVSPQQAEWLRRQLREKHMTDSIFHGLAIGLSLLASCPPGTRVSTMDFGRSMAYLGRAGWDNENTLEIQGERHLLLLQDMEMIDGEHRLTYTGEDVRTELTLPIHMSLVDIAGQLNPGGPDGVREAAELEWAEPEPEPEPPAEPEGPDQENGHHEGGLGAPSSAPPIVPRSAVADSDSDDDSDSEFVTSVASPIVTRTPPPPEPDEPTSESVPPPVAAAAPATENAEPEVPAEPAAAEPPVPEAPAPPVDTPPVAAVVPDQVASVPPPVAAPVPDEAVAASVPPPVVEPPVVAPVAGEDIVAPAPPVQPPVSAEAVDAPASPVVEPPVAPPVPDEAVAASVPPPVAAPVPDEPAATSVAPPVIADPVGSGPEFVTAAAIRAAAEGSGLRLPDGVYANVAAAVSTGKHLVLTGAPGSGKTTLALAIARAAAQAGRAQGATVVTAAPERDLLVEAAGRGRWVVVDELDQSEDVDAAFGSLSTFLAGIPVTLASNDDATPAEDWRIVATWNGGSPAGAVLRRFAVIEVAAPSAGEVRALVEKVAGGDPVATAAVGRLLDQKELATLGAGVFLDAARHAAARNAAAPADAATLAREAFVAYVAPLHPELDAEILDAR